MAFSCGCRSEQLALVAILQVGVELYGSNTESAKAQTLYPEDLSVGSGPKDLGTWESGSLPGMNPTPSKSHASWCLDPGRPSIGTPYSLAMRAEARDISRSLAWQERGVVQQDVFPLL